MPQLSSMTEFYRPLEVRLRRPPKRLRTWLYLLFFFLTLGTTLVVGARLEYNFQHNVAAFVLSDSTLDMFPYQWALSHPANLMLGIPFAASLMLILLAHEMGHYLYCRYYGVYATLPFFVPFPNLFGTLGAFIRIKSPIRSRSALFDIGIAGPIAGFIFACIALVIGLDVSKPASVTSVIPEFQVQLGYPLVFRIAARILHTPSGGSLAHVNLHPIAIAAWVGMFATALNLLPGGQLDGGHITFAISPRLHRMVSALMILVLIPLAMYRWKGWLIWAVLLSVSGLRHPVVPAEPGITHNRHWVAILGLLVLVLTFTSTPVRLSGSESVPDLRDIIHQLWQWVRH